MSRHAGVYWGFSVLLLSAGMGRAEERKSEIQVEVKYVVVANEVAERLRQLHLLANSNRGKDLVYLDERERRLFVEVVQSDIRSNVMQAPKITMLDGESNGIKALDEQTITRGATIVQADRGITFRPREETVSLGVEQNLRSKISADRRSVRVNLDTQLTNLDESEPSHFSICMVNKHADDKAPSIEHIEQPRIVKMGVKRTLDIPDGKTAVLSAGMKMCQVSETVGPECLKEIPLVRKLFCTTETHPEVHHLFVMVTPTIIVPRENEENKTQKNTAKKITFRSCDCSNRTLILPPVSQSQKVECGEPGEARVLRAMPALISVPGIFETSRDNIEIVTERIVNKLDPPRFYPLVGLAQFHHTHWKCTVSYTETVRGSYPIAFRWTRPMIHVVYLDLNHLHAVASDIESKK
jgi:hypothetical protein